MPGEKISRKSGKIARGCGETFQGNGIALGEDTGFIDLQFMMDELAILRKEVWFSGRVQGVGFRYTTSRIAREFEVSGWVKNLPDGRVHLVVEGSAEEVRGFVEEVSDQMESFIRKVEEEDSHQPEGLAGFSIAR